MFCSPRKLPAGSGSSGLPSKGEDSLTLHEKALMNKADIESDENLLSCCQVSPKTGLWWC
jgi:hypothetical protein